MLNLLMEDISHLASPAWLMRWRISTHSCRRSRLPLVSFLWHIMSAGSPCSCHVGGLWEVLRDLSCEVSAYLDDSKNEKISLTDAPQLFNLLYDRFDTATKEECKQKGKEKLQSDEEDEATIEL